MEQQMMIDPTIEYDIVELPSKGIYYPNKKKTVKVSYLTAVDENILSSSNLAKSNTIITELLKQKITDKDILVEDLVDEDREAILVFLRNTAFGTDYKLKIIDPKTKEPFYEDVDLSTLKIKDFNLNEDSNGEYDFYMKKSEIPITFTFLNKKQKEEIKNIEKNWNGVEVAPVVTKELEFMIKSVNGNREPMEILHYIKKMPIKDSQDFRKFVNENKPGLDLTRKVTTPSGEDIQVEIGFGVEFFRPFYGL